MTDLSQVPDDELLAMYAMPALIKQESGGRAGVLGPQTRYGRAEGMTQMLPATAKQMAGKLGLPWRPELMRGSTPEAADYQERLGQAYLQEGIQKTGNLPDAFRYYHGGPDKKLWGPKTNGYAESVMNNLSGGSGGDALEAPDLSAVSDDELLAMYQGAEAAPAPAAAMPAQAAPPPRMAAARPPQAPPMRQGPTIAQDAASGFVQPFKDLGATVSAQMGKTRGPPTSVGDFLKGAFVDPVVETGQLLGGVAGLASAPIQAAVRPTARALNRVAPPMYAKGPSIMSPEFWDNKADIPRRLNEGERQAEIEGVFNTALSAAQPAGARAPVVPKTKAPNLAELETAKRNAYAAVDASGYRFKQQDLKSLAADAARAIDDAGGPELNEQATKMANRIQSLADRGDLTLSQLDKVRAQVGEKVIAKGESTVGYALRDLVDGLIDSAQVPEMRQARAANMRYMKVKEVTDRLESADLAQATSGNGGNSNAPRQKLRPLIDPKSNQRMKNLTPAEAKALKKVVKPGAGEGALRALSAFDPTAGKLQALLQTIAAVPTGGLSALTAPVGMAARVGEGAIANSNVKKLLDLLATGGGPAASAPKIPVLSMAGKPALRVATPAGLVGASTVAAPLVQRPPTKAAKANAQPAKSKQRR